MKKNYGSPVLKITTLYVTDTIMASLQYVEIGAGNDDNCLDWGGGH